VRDFLMGVFLFLWYFNRSDSILKNMYV